MTEQTPTSSDQPTQTAGAAKLREQLAQAMASAPSERPMLPSLLSAVEVELTVDLGEAQVALGDLDSLPEGHVLTLDRKADDLVVLRANGVPVAEGHLVNQDGEYAFQVERLNAPASPQL